MGSPSLGGYAILKLLPVFGAACRKLFSCSDRLKLISGVARKFFEGLTNSAYKALTCSKFVKNMLLWAFS